MSVLALSLALLSRFEPVVEWTSSKGVTGLVRTGDGTYAASTMGGLLERKADGVWKKQTTADGLPSDELLALEVRDGRLVVQTRLGAFSLNGTVWKPVANDRAVGSSSLSVDTAYGRVVARPLLGLFAGDKPFSPGFPPEALPILAIAGEDRSMIVGTAGHGLWELSDGSWRHVDLNEPSGNSIQALAEFEGSIYASTLADGLSRYSKGKWSLITGLSSTAPREAVTFKGALWLRHANGAVDRFKDGKWEAGILKSVLPRKEARFLATDGKRLFVAQWGGWSVFDGDTWKHDLKRPELAGVATTCLFPDGDRLWIGTQGKCLAVADLNSEKVEWIDERSGMTDDWVTCLAKLGEDVFVGTFVGGLVKVSRGGAKPLEMTKGENVTCLSQFGGALLVATRSKVYSFNGYNLTVADTILPQGQAEVQSLLSTDSGLWIGTRTGLYLAGH